jgi:hypothetical protein
MTAFERKFTPLYERWREDINFFVQEGLNFGQEYPGTGPTWQQKQLLDVVQLESQLPVGKRRKRIAVRSGQGPGKTAISFAVAMWRCIRYPDALCVVTAPNMRQCKQFIDEGRRIMKDAHPFLQGFVECYGTKMEINKNPIWGIRSATASRPQNLQGIHEKRLTFIADEASGVARPIIETIKGTLSNPDALFLAIGNPNTTDCGFHEFFTTQADQWHTLGWNAEDTARDYPHIVHPSRNKALELEYGRDSDVYRVRVLGEFPRSDPNALMAIDDLIACTKTQMFGCATITDILPISRAFGIDYARYGSDESVVVRRSGLAVVDYKVFVKCDPREVTDYAFRLQYDAGWKNEDCWYIPDAGGMGQGIVHSFHEGGKQVFEFHTQGVAGDSSMYADAYSEAWWNFRNLVVEHIVHIPNDPRLIKQLSTRQYYTDRKGRLKVETKDEWRDRTEIDESPDRADAVVMSFYSRIGREGKIAGMNRRPYKLGSKVRRSR